MPFMTKELQQVHGHGGFALWKIGQFRYQSPLAKRCIDYFPWTKQSNCLESGLFMPDSTCGNEFGGIGHKGCVFIGEVHHEPWRLDKPLDTIRSIGQVLSMMDQWKSPSGLNLIYLISIYQAMYGIKNEQKHPENLGNLRFVYYIASGKSSHLFENRSESNLCWPC